MSSSTPDDVATILAYHNGAARYAVHSRDREHLARLREPFMALLPERPLVLDLGSGPGHDSALLAKLGATVVPLDPAEGLLREASRYPAIASRCVVGDARRLPFAAASFDGIWSCASLLHVPHQEVPGALAEAARVLKPGGFAFLSMSEGEPGVRVPDTSLGLATRAYYYHRAEEWGSLLVDQGFQLIFHSVNHESGNFNAGSTGWIETYARKR
jgi:ubiquinone/menaquinone biosynthesis C-methylase UbiE